MNKNEIQLSKIDLNYPISENLLVKDIKQSKLSPQAKDIILASRCYGKIGTRASEVFTSGKLKGIEVRQFEIRQHVNRAILDSGFGANMEKEDISELINSVVKDVLIDFSHLTTQEVEIAFRNGCRELYGEFYGVSTRTFYKWLKAYCEQSKIEANKELIKLDAPKVDAEPSEEEKQKRFNTWLTTFYNDFNSFVKTGEYNIYDTDNMFYHFLQKKQLIPKLSDVKKAAILKKAKEVVKAQYQPEDNANVFQKNEYKRFIERIKNKDKGVQYEITAEAKRIHLKLFLTSLKKKNVDLKSLVEKKSN